MRELHLGLNALGAGTHRGAWRWPESDPLGIFDPDHWIGLAQTAERATFDLLFLADLSSFTTPPAAGPSLGFDTSVLLSTLAGVTSRLGLVGTSLTTYDHPFHVARRFSSLDHLSRGRAAWNAVTGANPASARNFGGLEHPDRAERYARADEFLTVVHELWDSWEDGALVGDAAAGRYGDAAHIHRIEHAGTYFEVEGPSLLPRSPQGRPVQVQAGASTGGLGLAAKYAEMVFTSAGSLEDAERYATNVRRRLALHGRAPDALKILPGLVFTLGGTEAEARARWTELNALAGEQPLQWLAFHLGVAEDELAWDKPLPEHALSTDEIRAGSTGARDIIVNLARRERLTARQLLERVSGWHRQFIGTPEQLADSIQEWFETGLVDGFNLMPDVLPSGLDAFVEHVVPILRDRGLFRREYTGTTLRDHLGLQRPVSRYARKKVAA
ncbi:LLM class flavin-dependent oxidoreductase [Solirubrobacter phytolaccae]|uniref:LLM class flavin-dependent oxidoreductase n=1 Tax=Solirubrobacter phytolaccae TaxID=1404360 RepID=A0A9X3NF89_9ACTN|nr:LLM class flavin-dependent oxidoreductase [Solirubrobacter phytolaccae]MDA0183041.1 LLM class flavin-dependent oxidoreductase [Solirubrobacter phytolaccae]